MRDPRVAHVAFTGSVAVGHAVSRAAADRFISVGLELGGKDPAYVRADADLGFAAENLVDGAFFNSGQSCCGIERIYVHEAVFEDFVARAVAVTKLYRLGDPTSPETNFGPVVSAKAAAFIRAQMDGGDRPGRAGADRSAEGFETSRARHGLSRAADSGGCGPWHAGDDRGDVRAGRRDHEGRLG